MLSALLSNVSEQVDEIDAQQISIKHTNIEMRHIKHSFKAANNIIFSHRDLLSCSLWIICVVINSYPELWASKEGGREFFQDRVRIWVVLNNRAVLYTQQKRNCQSICLYMWICVVNNKIELYRSERIILKRAQHICCQIHGVRPFCQDGGCYNSAFCDVIMRLL